MIIIIRSSSSSAAWKVGERNDSLTYQRAIVRSVEPAVYRMHQSILSKGCSFMSAMALVQCRENFL